MGFDHWMTPPEQIEAARTFMGRIDLDPASNYVAQQYVRAATYAITREEEDFQNKLYEENKLEVTNSAITGTKVINGLGIPWYGNVWTNPPYSKDLINLFVGKVVHESYNTQVKNILLLVNSQTDTGWYHQLLENAQALLLYKGRLKFWKVINNRAYDKWEGEKSKQEGAGKIGNSPRYLNSLFLFTHNDDYIVRFKQLYSKYGHVIIL